MAEGKVDFHKQDSHALGKKQVNNGRSAEQNPDRLHQPLKQPQLKCPECASERLYKDGMRYLSNGESVQRWLCRDCAYRFSEKPLQENQDWQLNNGFALFSNRQECGESHKRRAQTLQTGGLALVTVETRQETAPREGTDTSSLLFQFAWWLKKEGYAETTITTRAKLLRILTKRGADLDNPESIKERIAEQTWCNKRKINAADAYTAFLRMGGRKWDPPRYRTTEKLPFIPTEAELDALIAGCGPKTSTFLQLLKETGARAGEAHALTWTDLDLETGTIRITPEKGSKPRIFRLSTKLLSQLLSLKTRSSSNRIFSKHLRTQRRLFAKQRATLTRKLQNPRLPQIHFHTFRHWKATMEYHKTKDILHVMQTLGHKNIMNTLKYTQLVNFEGDEFTSKATSNTEEARKLIEAGFEYTCTTPDETMLFRKRK